MNKRHINIIPRRQHQKKCRIRGRVPSKERSLLPYMTRVIRRAIPYPTSVFSSFCIFRGEQFFFLVSLILCAHFLGLSLKAKFGVEHARETLDSVASITFASASFAPLSKATFCVASRTSCRHQLVVPLVQSQHGKY